MRFGGRPALPLFGVFSVRGSPAWGWISCRLVLWPSGSHTGAIPLFLSIMGFSRPSPRLWNLRWSLTEAGYGPSPPFGVVVCISL